MTAAWHGAAFGRVKKMPTLEKVIGEKRAAVKMQSHQQMLAAMQSLVGRS
ncbi:hypothetical protein SAMN02927924_02817 [Sphingobium faniae]|nr:hypothetical protein SAMN02927924_02817 [Sphingobium faniae]